MYSWSSRSPVDGIVIYKTDIQRFGQACRAQDEKRSIKKKRQTEAVYQKEQELKLMLDDMEAREKRRTEAVYEKEQELKLMLDDLEARGKRIAYVEIEKRNTGVDKLCDIGDACTNSIEKYVDGTSATVYYTQLMRKTVKFIREETTTRLSTKMRKHQLAMKIAVDMPFHFDGDEVRQAHMTNALALRINDVNKKLGSAYTRKEIQSWKSGHSVSIVPPLCVRYAIHNHLLAGKELRTTFINDRLRRQSHVMDEHTRIKNRDVSEWFVNTPHTWYRKDPFILIPHDVLTIILSFIPTKVNNSMSASNYLAHAALLVEHATIDEPVYPRDQGRTNKCSECLRNTAAPTCRYDCCSSCCSQRDCSRHSSSS